MSCPFRKDSLDALRQFIDVCTGNPDLLSSPELGFFRTYLESLGAKIPQPRKPKTSTEPPADKPQDTKDSHFECEDEEEIEDEPESDLELETEGCVEPDAVDPNQKMGDSNKELTEEEMEKANEKRSEAVCQFSEGNFEEAIKLYTAAIEINATSALLFAKRGQVYLKLVKPNACVKDCTKALELNPDSAAAYKFRGRAYRLLGEWEKAAKDLRQACTIDMDEQTDEWLKEVTPNAQKIEQHRLKQERRQLEKEKRERLKRAKKAREAHAKASAESNASAGAGAGAGAGGPPPKADDFYKLMQDPEIMAAFTDPEVSAAFADISSNPANFYKYQSNPKVMALITKLSGKLAASGISPGMGGFPGFPGGLGGFPGFGGGAAPGAEGAPNFKPPEDDNLD